MSEYYLIMGDSGQGNMGDYKEKEIAKFTSLGKAVKFFTDNKLVANWDNKEIDFDLDKDMHEKGGHRGIGTRTYRLTEKMGILTNPTSLKELWERDIDQIRGKNDK